MNALQVRPPAVAGVFYPAEPGVLRAELSALLASAAAAGPLPAAHAAPIKALIVPHAGYLYSGAIAARAYAALRRQARQIRRVVLLGPAHRVPLRGLAVPGCQAFATPLGPVPIDAEAVRALRALPQVIESPQAHAQEHALEVQLPFLLEVLGDGFQLVPLVVGDASAEAVAAVLEWLWGGPETLLVISSDLSHYLPYASAQQRDRATVARIQALVPELDQQQACGATPINGLLLAARRHGLQAQVLDQCNSGDTAGDRQRVVGYAALAFTVAAAANADPAEPDTQDRELGVTLLGHARAAIAEALAVAAPARREHPLLDRVAACFVSLHHQQALRGCIGSLQAHESLRQGLRRHALAAAFEDPRFPPVQAPEWPALSVEVSLLSALEPWPALSEAAALARLRPHRDGLVLECQGYRSTFLPQVWESLPQPRDFLAQLKRKAGLPMDFWSPQLRLSRYSVSRWHEAELPS